MFSVRRQSLESSDSSHCSVVGRPSERVGPIIVNLPFVQSLSLPLPTYVASNTVIGRLDYVLQPVVLLPA